MLPKTHRLASDPAIQRVVRQGRRLHSPCLTFFYLATNPSQATRVACVVSKKVSSSSVIRHRCQRIMRSAAVAIITRWPRQYDIVLVAKPFLTTLKSVKPLQQELLQLANHLYPT